MAMGPAPLPPIGLVLGPHYALTSDVGAFVLTGRDATLTEAGNLGQSGAPAPFPALGLVLEYVANRSLAADAGAFAIDAAPSLSDLALTAETGPFTLGGQDAIVAFNRAALIASAGAYTLTGQFATLTGVNEYRLVAEAGGFALSGVAVPLLPSRSLGLDTTTYTLDGLDAGFVRGLRLSAERGSYTAAGWPAAMLRAGGTARYGRRRIRTAVAFRRT